MPNIHSVAARLRSTSLAVGPFKPLHITESPQLPRTTIGPASEHLYAQLLTLYWNGVERDVQSILRALREWSPEQNPVLEEENDTFIYGYDTFLDQVSETQRHKAWVKSGTQDAPGPLNILYEKAIANRAWEVRANAESDRRRAAVRKTLGSSKKHDILKRRARMLLQSAQWLDFDKIVEHREPFDTGLRRDPAQLKITLDENKQFKADNVCCSTCKSPLRGPMFASTQDPQVFLCQGCYFHPEVFGREDYIKNGKTCPLDRDITPDICAQTCNCPAGGNPVQYPLPDPNKIRHVEQLCRLGNVLHVYGEARFSSTKLKQEKKLTMDDLIQKMSTETWRAKNKGQFEVTRGPNNGWDHKMPDFGSEEIHKDSGGTPYYLRPAGGKRHLSNMHMAVRFGPLVIENGVANTNGGVVITTKDRLRLLHRDAQPPVTHKDETSLLISGLDRTLYSQNRSQAPTRNQLVMKQVVGGGFCGFLNPTAEDEIVDFLIQGSQNQNALEQLLAKLKDYLSLNVELHLQHIASKLIDPTLDISWNFVSNNCKDFCDKLLNIDTLQYLFPPDMSDANPPAFMLSFVCQPGPPVAHRPWSRYDVPNGLVEEYLLRLHNGRHSDSDFIDSLSEYWYDFGAFPETPYPNQDLFPWDCSEGYGRHPTKCGTCNISKHVWAYPFDSLSIISMHLARDSFLYSRNDPDQGPMSQEEWFSNRIRLLVAQDNLLTTAAAMAKTPQMHHDTQWLAAAAAESSSSSPSFQRVKLGSIHRAQPYSHHYDRGVADAYFAPDWITKMHDVRLREYESKRDSNMREEDMGYRPEHYKRTPEANSSFFKQTSRGGPRASNWARTPGNPWNTTDSYAWLSVSDTADSGSHHHHHGSSSSSSGGGGGGGSSCGSSCGGGSSCGSSCGGGSSS